MAKKKPSEKKTSVNRVKPLERLLKTGESETYGQLCWSLGNRDTKVHKPGQVVTVAGWEDNGKSNQRKFRLTGQSIENINRCLGMRTCGEAVELFRETPNPKHDYECPDGHQETAWDYMMYGIVPTKPCPDCGQMPTFHGLSMSLGFRTGRTAKGTDGREYHTCPECGDEYLELQGSNPVGWGWEIVCTNCEWHIKEAEELDIQQYSQLMEDIKLKVSAIHQLMEMPGIINQTRVEAACLQLRMVLELIVFSSLVSNKDAWKKSQEELRKAWNIKKIMVDLKGIHGKYYPEPKGQGHQFLTQDRLVTIYDKLNKIIHAENPLGNEINLREYMESIPAWVDWSKDLLNEHKVYLYHHPEVFYWVRMFGGPEGDVECTPIRAASDGKQICPWPDCVQDGNRLYCEYIEEPWEECSLEPEKHEQVEAKAWAGCYDRGSAPSE